MIQSLFRAIKLTLLLLVLCIIIYPLLLLLIAQFAPNKGKGIIIVDNNKTYYSLIGQNFNNPTYFQSRPSTNNYNPKYSGGSYLGPTSATLLQLVSDRKDSFRKENPSITTAQIPSELLTASASGLDPHISPQGAKMQVPRIAKLRNIPQEKLYFLIDSLTQPPYLGFLGPTKINVLFLNLAIDKIIAP